MKIKRQSPGRGDRQRNRAEIQPCGTIFGHQNALRVSGLLLVLTAHPRRRLRQSILAREFSSTMLNECPSLRASARSFPTRIPASLDLIAFSPRCDALRQDCRLVPRLRCNRRLHCRVDSRPAGSREEINAACSPRVNAPSDQLAPDGRLPGTAASTLDTQGQER
jgi:hypothetical protein